MLPLGKKPHTVDVRDLKTRKYLDITVLPTLPSRFGLDDLVTDWGMLGNDQYGDCVFAGADHETMLWTLQGKKPATFTTKNTLSDYSAVTGFDPNDPTTDNGAEIRETLDYRQKTGMIDSKGNRHKIGPYLLLNQKNLIEVLYATWLFSANPIGIQVPEFAMDQFDNNQAWTVSSKNTNILGGHYVPLVGWDAAFIYCVTWGKLQPMTPAFFLKYCDEAWLTLSEEFLYGGESPEGFNLQQLKDDMAVIHDYVPPSPAPTPTPPPAPPEPPAPKRRTCKQELAYLYEELRQYMKK